ncbi:MAG TPA: hypothetical protein VF921_09510 [Vicinamibacterales bacterium]
MYCWRLVRVLPMLLVAAGVSIHGSAQAKPTGGLDPDETAMRDYVLTVDKAQRYMDVARKMEGAGQQDPALAAEMKRVQDTDVYNVEKAGLVEKSPHLAAFFKTVNFSPRDFVLVPLAIGTAAAAASMPDNGGPAFAYVNRANIQFVKDHKDDLKKWGFQ